MIRFERITLNILPVLVAGSRICRKNRRGIIFLLIITRYYRVRNRSIKLRTRFHIGDIWDNSDRYRFGKPLLNFEPEKSEKSTRINGFQIDRAVSADKSVYAECKAFTACAEHRESVNLAVPPKTAETEGFISMTANGKNPVFSMVTFTLRLLPFWNISVTVKRYLHAFSCINREKH